MPVWLGLHALPIRGDGIGRRRAILGAAGGLNAHVRGQFRAVFTSADRPSTECALMMWAIQLDDDVRHRCMTAKEGQLKSRAIGFLLTSVSENASKRLSGCVRSQHSRASLGAAPKRVLPAAVPR